MGKLLKSYKLNKRILIAKRIVVTVIAFGISLIVFFPIAYMISNSFKLELDIFKVPFHLMPERFVNNYDAVWRGAYNFSKFYMNSIKVTGVSVCGLIITSVLAAYGFSKIKFKGRDVLFIIYMATLMIPTQLTMIPRFMMYKEMGIYNTHWALILPGITTAFGTFLLRQFMISVPYELNESAKIDGAGELRILCQIILPLIKPGIITLILISVVWSWNDYENAMLFLTNKDLYTIPIGLLSFMDETGKQYSLIMAAAVSAALPPMALFVCGQKYFVEGLSAGAVKG